MTLPERTPIAVVGVSYRLPGTGRKGLYQYLSEGKSSFTRIPQDRFEQEAYHSKDSEKAGVFSPEGAHFLSDDIYAFDASFFNMTAEEAKSMDPHHRIMLECAFEAAENAGMPLSELYGSNTGVFATSDRCAYGEQLLNDLPTTTKYSTFSASSCMAANRVSYFMGLKGPSISVDTACSSSTYAVHLACQSLRSKECKTAFTGAASLILTPHTMVALDALGALSPDGKCHSYDSRRNGFGVGEGSAFLVLKRLEDALADGDAIHSVIKHTSCNHSGHTRGITMPSQSAQEDIIHRVHAEVGLKPSDTGFMEGHGTGTEAGDPIEGAAVASVMGRDREGPVYIGSAKTNFGHLLSTSGMVSIAKAMTMLQHAMILPNSGFEEMSPELDSSKLNVPQVPIPWPSEEPRRVCVTNFGFGGSNAAVLLEEFRDNALRTKDSDGREVSETVNGVNGSEMSRQSTQPRLFSFSAKSEKPLTSLLASFASYLNDLHLSVTRSDAFLSDLSFTLGQRRTHFNYRTALVAESVEELVQQLSSLTEPSIGKIRPEQELVSAFVFTGQGAQHATMAARLSDYEPFAAALLSAESCLQEFGATWTLAEELFKSEEEGSRIDDPEISQPACTAVQLGLVALLQSWGISPAVVCGHSSGEIVAAYAAGFVSFKTAMALAFFRGKAAVELQQEPQTSAGGMVALGTDLDTASQLQDATADIGRTCIAAINSPKSLTISGDIAAIESISQIAEVQGIFNRKLKVGVAYHSHHMESVAASYQAAIEPFCDPEWTGSEAGKSVTFFSSVTGLEECFAIVKEASYWVKNLVSTVKFAEAIESLLAKGESGRKSNVLFVELGPHPALKGPIKQILQATDETKATYYPTLSRDTDNLKALLGLAGHIFKLGGSLDFANINKTLSKKAHVLTDLPSYQWNKDVRYFRRLPRASQEMHPGHPYNPLLGWKMPSEGDEHVFRQVFSLADMPWIRDHQVDGDAFFPFVGFVRLAVEALKATSKDLSSVSIRELHVKRILVVSTDQDVDMTTKLRRAEMGTEKFSSNIWAFEVMTWTYSVGWTVHAYGRIESDTVDFAKTGSLGQTLAEHALATAPFTEKDVEREYEMIRESGITLGPTFRNMTKLLTAPGVAFQEAVPPRIDQDLLQGSQLFIDVVMLDSLLHCARGAFFGEESNDVFVPVYSSQFQLSTMSATPDLTFTTVARGVKFEKVPGLAHVHYVVFASTESGRVPYAELDMTFQRLRVSGSDTGIGGSNQERPEGFYTTLVPHIEFAECDTLAELLADSSLDPTQLFTSPEVAAVSRHFLASALKLTADYDLSSLPSHYAKFLHWAESQLRENNDDLIITPQLIEEVSKASAAGELLCVVGERIPQILRGEVEPLEIMVKDGLLTRYYEENVQMRRSSEALARYAASLGEINPKLRILEVGAGTGGATLPILEALSHRDSPPSFSRYVFTDISSGFFENARHKLSRWPELDYQKLDITQDPAQQGIEIGTYDLVVAVNVLHATPDIETTISNVRSLLKPYTGKLGIVEHAENNDPAVLPFALLPGWWLASDKYRALENGPLMPQDSWHQVLTSTGFSGVDCAIKCGGGGTFWTSRVEAQNHPALPSILPSTSDPVTICSPLTTRQDVELAEAVAQAVGETLHIPTPRTQSTADLHDIEDRFCIFIDSANDSFLTQITSEQHFNQLKSILLNPRGLLWVTPEHDSPDYSRIKGILRTLRLEDPSRKLLQVDGIPADTVQGPSVVVQLILNLIQDMTPRAFREQDFVWQNGILHVPRLRRLKETTETFALESSESICKKQGIWTGRGAEDTRRLSIHTPGNLDSIYFEHEDLTRTALGDEEILVKVAAVGINFRDVLTCLGTVPWSPPGREGAGIVVGVGGKVSQLQAGDRVFFGKEEGSFSTYVRIPGIYAYKLPPSIPFEVAAGLPAAYTTAFICLENVAHIQQGETVLIHAASGAVGQACINVAQSRGAVVFATAGSVEKREFLHQTFGIPYSHISNSRTTEFRQKVLSGTDGRGVDVVINSLSGQLLQETWSLIAEFGRFIEIGKKDLLENNHLSMRKFLPNVTFTTVSIDGYASRKPKLLQGLFGRILEMLENQAIKPILPLTKLSISEVQSGFRKLQSGQNIGKIVVSIGDDDEVMAECVSPLQQCGRLLQENATYLITGGTGGIGRAIVPMLLANGASNVIILGRSGDSNPEVAAMVREHDKPSKGIHVRAIPCDVASRVCLRTALYAIRDLPPVRGVIHGSLFLRDSIFMNATFKDWQNINAPKIDGAWHIHELLPTLDFFVALSSATGVFGNIGQSIYSGTSSFLDAFAEYRTRQQSPSVSISLPIVDDVGYVVERDGLRAEMMQNTGGVKLSISQVLAAVKGAIIGATSGLNKDSKTIMFVREDIEGSVDWADRSHYLTAARRRNLPKKDGTTQPGDKDISCGEGHVLESLRAKLSAITMMADEDITPHRQLSEYGLDSLVAVELRHWVKCQFGLDLALSQIVGAEHLQSLANRILSSLGRLEKA
ncbi:unnamed protein product [Penicillium salamii]|nr:unnamed protein product [Penicillium salamii]CAG8268454.1 unnamed protein product [Penicillium salamii]